MELLNVKREEIVGVGDSYNDFPLLEAAGLKIAMENGHSEIKEIADFVVPSHENDGVAYLIDRLLENKEARI
jgi:hydroxymethylpyrimidine pyrophosphatase-like HAD family hydrolase